MKRVNFNLFDQEFEKLKSAIDLNDLDNKNIFDLINWCRQEYTKVPFIYPGDEYVISVVKEYVSIGFNISVSIEKSKGKIKKNISYKLLRSAMGK